MIIVSACLLGMPCRYDGNKIALPAWLDQLPKDRILPVCPEQMGGLPTPREAATLHGGDGQAVLEGKARVLTRSGKDVTGPFLAGAEAVLQLISRMDVEKAILKEKSPSCGVYRTNQDGTVTPGKGVTAAALAKAGIPLLTEEDNEI